MVKLHFHAADDDNITESRRADKIYKKSQNTNLRKMNTTPSPT